jgi:hypothetical protein
VDLAGIAKSAGFTMTMSIKTKSELSLLKNQIYKESKTTSGPLFAQVKVDPEKLPLVLPPREGAYLKNRFRIALLGTQAALALID